MGTVDQATSPAAAGGYSSRSYREDVVLHVLGISGALTYFAPVQPLLGFIGVALLLVGLAVRLRRDAACPVMTA